MRWLGAGEDFALTIQGVLDGYLNTTNVGGGLAPAVGPVGPAAPAAPAAAGGGFDLGGLFNGLMGGGAGNAAGGDNGIASVVANLGTAFTRGIQNTQTAATRGSARQTPVPRFRD